MTHTPHWQNEHVTLFHGDCLDVLRELDDSSVDSVVCDPPYGLANTSGEQVAETLTRWLAGDREYIPSGAGFMGKSWDAFVPPVAVWDECMRVLKPGGHLLAFAGSRTLDLMALGVRLAGFEIRDSIAWLYGSGFPKSLDVSKAIDAAAGATREVVGRPQGAGNGSVVGLGTGRSMKSEYDATAPATDAAKVWDGWGTALKPAFEPVVVARKPLAGTVAGNVLAYGTGALNIDATRTETSDNLNGGTYSEGGNRKSLDGDERDAKGQGMYSEGAGRIPGGFVQPAGRWPTNVVLDESQAAELDAETGTLAPRGSQSSGSHEGMFGTRVSAPGYKDEGGASRFFPTFPMPTFRYEAKAPTRERPSYVKDGAGTGRVTGLGGKVRQCNVCETRAIESGASEPSCGHGDFRWEEPTTDTESKVAHPTVKPLDLMRWLVRLVTPAGGVILEPFAGSGTTVEAAVLEGFRCIAIEREADYLPLIEQRLAKPMQQSLFDDLLGGDAA